MQNARISLSEKGLLVIVARSIPGPGILEIDKALLSAATVVLLAVLLFGVVGLLVLEKISIKSDLILR